MLAGSQSVEEIQQNSLAMYRIYQKDKNNLEKEIDNV